MSKRFSENFTDRLRKRVTHARLAGFAKATQPERYRTNNACGTAGGILVTTPYDVERTIQHKGQY